MAHDLHQVCQRRSSAKARKPTRSIASRHSRGVMSACRCRGGFSTVARRLPSADLTRPTTARFGVSEVRAAWTEAAQTAVGRPRLVRSYGGYSVPPGAGTRRRRLMAATKIAYHSASDSYGSRLLHLQAVLTDTDHTLQPPGHIPTEDGISMLAVVGVGTRMWKAAVVVGGHFFYWKPIS